jgi:drug/metabolite transporter (DMT)-like permease
MGTHGVSPFALCMARLLGAALVLVPLAARRSGPRVLTARDRGGMLLLSLLGIVFNQVLFLLGLKRTSPLSATLLIATIPVFTLALAVATRRERLEARTAIGIGVAFFGVVVLSGFAVPALGDTFVLLNAASYATYLILARPYLERFGAFTVMAWAFGLGAIVLAPLGGPALVLEAPNWSLTAVALVGWIVAIPTIFAYLLNAFALKRASPVLVTVYVYVQPTVVALLAWVQLGERPEVRALAAGALIFAGVTIVATRRAPLVPAVVGVRRE